MQLRKWCVTVMDNWTPVREFWTHRAASKFRNKHSQYAYLYRWKNGGWVLWEGAF